MFIQCVFSEVIINNVSSNCLRKLPSSRPSFQILIVDELYPISIKWRIWLSGLRSPSSDFILCIAFGMAAVVSLSVDGFTNLIIIDKSIYFIGSKINLVVLLTN